MPSRRSTTLHNGFWNSVRFLAYCISRRYKSASGSYPAHPSASGTCLHGVCHADVHFAPFIPSSALSNGPKAKGAIFLAESQVSRVGHSPFVCGCVFLGVSRLIFTHRCLCGYIGDGNTDSPFYSIRAEEDRRPKGTWVNARNKVTEHLTHHLPLWTQP